VVAVVEIDLSVQACEALWLAGTERRLQNTPISICATRSRPTSGQVIIAGCDVIAKQAVARGQIGVVLQFNALDRR